MKDRTHRPVIKGKWRVLFTPRKTGGYVTDHAMIRGDDGLWHLFGILIFRSRDRYDFGEYNGQNENKVAIQKLRAHAPIYLKDDETDKWYITTCGWPDRGTINPGSVSIAEMERVEE